MSTYKATIEERGNGLADAGDYVTEQGSLYRVIRTYGPIHTQQPGAPNYIHAVVEDADWADVGDDNEPVCTAVVGDEIDAERDAINAVLPDAGDDVYRDDAGWHVPARWGNADTQARQLEAAYQSALNTP